MQKTFILFLLLSGVCQNLWADPITVTGKLERVTVYRRGAKLSGTATATTTADAQEIVISGLTTRARAASLRVTVRNPAIQLLTATYRVGYLPELANQARVKVLRDSVRLLDEQTRALQDRIDVYRLEEKTTIALAENKTGGERGATIEEITKVGEFYQKRLNEIKIAVKKIQKEQVALNAVYTKTNTLLQYLKPKQEKAVGEIVLTIKNGTAASSDIDFSLMTDEAFWLPMYDIRANDQKAAMQITSRATLYQATAQDWKNVKIRLSSGNPNANNDLPKLASRSLDIYKPTQDMLKDEDGDGVPDRLDRESNTPKDCPVDARGEALDSDGDGIKDCLDREPYTAPGYPVDAYGVATPVQTGINYAISYHNETRDEVDETQLSLWRGQDALRTFMPSPPPIGNNTMSQEVELEGAQDVPSNGLSHIFVLKQFPVAAFYTYYSVPSVETATFLVAKIPNFSQYNLTEGNANLFVGETYIGNSILKPNNVVDTLELSFGRDERVSISHKKLVDFEENRVFSSLKREKAGYEITIRNQKTEAINLNIIDNIPVAKNKDVEIEKDDISGATYDNTDGKLTWQIVLKAGETRKLRVTYTIKYPKANGLIKE
jgi:Domain of unknown function (DUF4139)/N-terminal domain of unknown function (DUF4140)